MRNEYSHLLKRYWGYDSFRSIQADIIESIVSGHDTLGLMPTGGGKSITFQVPALAMEGVCIVITPLIALMKDQVQNLRRRGIIAAAIYSGMQHDEIVRTLENCILGSTKLLYVSPERLGSELFQAKLRHMLVSFITVDEAHCISQWGYDFRPAYLEIVNIRKLLPNVPVLALTATATPKVVDDIQQKLTLTAPSGGHTGGDNGESHTGFNVFSMSFERSNLAYIVRTAPDKLNELQRSLSETDGSAIVYVRSRRRSKEIASWLCEAGHNATFFHAGLEQSEKDRRQNEWQQDKIRVMVATNAFGMGIDKPDVRIVVHYDCPDSLEAYFQEAGRAGRDGKPAQAVLLYNTSDNAKLAKRIDENFPPREYIKEVYEHLAYYYQIAVGDGYGVVKEFDLDEFCRRFHHFPVRVHAALLILQRAGYIDYDEARDSQARVHFLIGRDDLYRLRQLSGADEKVIVAMLRNYGGMFADYAYIDEELIAQLTSLARLQVHEILKSLSQRHLLHFIPGKHIPHIRYAQRREDTQYVSIPREVYEDRLEQYRQRITAMLNYIQDDSRCRSRQLLAYFGETDTHDCHQCDVCIEQEGTHKDAETEENARQDILKLLSDGKRHHITELFSLHLPKDVVLQVMPHLVQEEVIRQEDGFITCCLREGKRR